MSEPQLLRLREEFRKTEKKKLEIESLIIDRENRLRLIEEVLVAMEKGQPTTNELLNALNITSKSPIALRFKVLGLKAQAETSMTQLKADRTNLLNTLSTLEVCPRCSGVGRTSSATKYERLQEGPIIPIPLLRECDLCGGSGKLVLADRGFHAC